MKNLNNYKISNPNLNIINYEYIEYFEGIRLLTLEEDINNELYIYSWVDYSNETNRYLICKILKENMEDYLNKKITLLNLYQCNLNNLYILFDEETNIYYKLKWEELPKDYLPEEDAYFDDFYLKKQKEMYETGKIIANYARTQKNGV